MGVLSTSMDSPCSSNRRRFSRESSQPEEETKDGASPTMAIDDVGISSSKSEISTGEGCEARSARNSAEIDCPIGCYSRTSSLLTDLTECLSESSNSSSNNSSSSTRLSAPAPAYAQQQQQPPLKTARHHLFKSSSSFQLSGYHGRPQVVNTHATGSYNNCCIFGHPACCQLAKHPNNVGANHSPLSPARNHVLAHHHCASGGQVPSPTALKMGHFQVGGFGAHFGGEFLRRQLHSGGGSSQALVQHQHPQSGHHQGGSASFALGGGFHPPTRSASSAVIASMAGAGGSCGCFSNCCCCCHTCDARQCRKQQSPTSSVNIHGSHEGLMSQGGHPMDNLPHPPSESGPPPLTAEGLSWRRLHMSRAKLKATATTSELLSGFAMVAMVELQINEPTNVPEWLFVLFAVCTTVLVSVHIFALMISTYILPNVDAVSKMQQCNQGELQASHGHYSTTFSSSGNGGDAAVLESPHERMRGFIELAWAFSTVLGLFLFLVELAILCWVKFWDHSFTAAWAATVIVIPVLVLFLAFAAHFYHSLVAIKCDTSASDMRDLERMKADLDAAARDASAASNV